MGTALKSCVFSLNPSPEEFIGNHSAIVFGQVATKVCWQDVGINLLEEGIQLIPMHKDLCETGRRR